MTIEQFWKSVAPSNERGCLLWTRGKHHYGYGIVRFDGQLWLAHRLAWVMEHGEISERTKVLHHCDEPACVNVDHLYIGSQADNKERISCGVHKDW